MSVFGIDLGTTNTCVSRFVDGQPVVVNIDGGNTVPSVVAWDQGKLIVGLAAKNLSFLNPDQAIRSIKRKMGQPLYRAILGDHSYSPIDISTEILKYVAQKAGESCGETVKKVVITVPAWFGDEQRRATMTAGEQAGLEVLRIINEPTAAALSYLTVPRNDAVPEHWMVYDLGGGTFDVSILSVNGEYKEVLASAGNTYLGGDDFDAAIAQKLVEVIRNVHGVDPSEDPVALARLRYLAEEAKIALSSELQWKVSHQLVVNGVKVDLDYDLSRDEFAALIQDLVESTIGKVYQAIQDAKIDRSLITRLLLVGGSTRVPCVQLRLQAEFKLTPEFYMDPDLSVALGAGFQAALVSGLSCQQIMVDVCPYSLGIAALGEHDQDQSLDTLTGYPKTCAPIIFRNSRLPAKCSRKFAKVFPEQEAIEVIVFQGESSHTADNTLIGRFICKLKPSHSMGFDVTFSYDANGIINIGVSQEQGKEPIKQYRMDTSKSASWNSEAPRVDLGRDFGLGDDDLFDDDTDEDLEDVDQVALSKSADTKLSNYLLDKIRQVIRTDQIPPSDGVHETVEAYVGALKDQEDDKMDDLEAKLYDWLEQREDGESQHGGQ